MKRISVKQQLLCRTAMDVDIPPSNPEVRSHCYHCLLSLTETPQEPPSDEDTNILQLPEDCLGLILDHLDPVTVGQLQRTNRQMYNLIETHQYWRWD